MFTSTQKPGQVDHVPMDVSSQDIIESSQETAESSKFPNAQNLFTPVVMVDEEDSWVISPDPNYKAVKEVLDVRTRVSFPESQQSKCPSLSAGPVRNLACSSKPGRNVEFNINQHTTRRESLEPSLQICRSSKSVGKSKKTANVKDSDGSSASELYPARENDSSMESDCCDSVIMFNPVSQMDFEQLFQSVEKIPPSSSAMASRDLMSLSDVVSMRPGEMFYIRAYLSDIQPRCPDSELKVALENILIAFCFECNRIWQYQHFKNSVSSRVRPRRRHTKVVQLMDQKLNSNEGC